MQQANSALTILAPAGEDPVNMALVGFLARYREPTRTNYVIDLKQYLSWCGSNGLHPFEVRRPHIEVYARWLEERNYALSTVCKRLSTVSGFYRFAFIDGYITSSPAEYVRRPRPQGESTTNGMDRMELAATRIVKRLARAAGITVRISPHSLRHAAITNALDAGVPLRDVQIMARHADPRTTSHYDRHRHNLDRSAVYVLTAYIAGGA